MRVHPLCTLILNALLCGLTHAQCNPLSDPGVRICTPTQNSTLAYPPAIRINSTPKSGSIYKFIVYDNNVNIFEGEPYQSGVNLYSGGMRNGRHYVVVNAWDTAGNLLQSSVTFNVIGNGYEVFCAAPKSPGINLCVPAQNSVQPSAIPLSVTATGYTRIAAFNFYLDNKLQFGTDGNNPLSSSVYPAEPGWHTVAAVAYDTSGHAFAASRRVLSTWDYLNCPPKGNAPCITGFVIDTPFNEDFVSSSFPVKASIQNNKLPITGILVYLDGTLVARSNGATISQTVTNAPSGSHILTFQAWDTAGHLYRVQQNVQINVPH